jgi:hypothetical protein
MAIDVITGNWTETKNPYIVSWTTDGSSVQGFGITKGNGKGKMYVDRNKNGKKDKGDQLIATTRVTEAATDLSNVGYGSWSVDRDSKIGSFLNPDGVELAVARFTSLSLF